MAGSTLSRSASADASWLERARAVIPGGTSTGSKRADQLYGPEHDDVPTHYTRASGCRLITAAGAELIDCTMALGAVSLGYADPEVTEAVQNAAAMGNVAGLAHVLEVELAERLCELIPCAERVRFLKSGAEGVAAAVRIARTHTGRATVLGHGYFGWLGWWRGGTGVPEGVSADFRDVPFDDVNGLEDAVARAGDTLAAVVLEPVIERLASREWIAAARRLCDERGALLILDEVKTGFRLRRGGYQELTGIVPDLAVFGKAMANGFPLAAVVGRAECMASAPRSWISSTLAGEATALAAAMAVLDRHAREDVCAELETIGRGLRAAVDRALQSSELDCNTDGLAPMWLLRAGNDAERDAVVRAAIRQGVLLKRGAYNFASLAHDRGTVAAVEIAVREGARTVASRRRDAHD